MTTDHTDELSTRTFGNEERLPRVPLPTLAESGERLLEWCAPLIDGEELARTRDAVADLCRSDGPGPRLQAALEAHDADPSVDSWLDDFWAVRYLGRRDRIALNANFFFLFADAERDQAHRAAGLIVAALDYKRQIDEESLPPAVRRGEPLAMDQHKYLFSATRIPGADQDTARTPYTDDWPGPSRARHVIVLVRGRMVRMDVVGPDGSPHTAAELADGLRAARDLAATPAEPETAVGHLTTEARAEWAASRRALIEADPGNADALDAVETALFCVSLEDLVPRDDTEASARLLDGDSANRWFDKVLSLIVFGDGTAGVNVEHCRLDGTTVLALVDAMLSEPTATHEERAGARTQGTPAVQPVDFVLSAELKGDVRDAASAFARYAAGFVDELMTFDDVGSDRAKGLGVSPDAFVQMACQLAHVRARGLTGSTYESIATRQYRHGRTEAMRVVTPEVVRFLAAMDDPAVDRATRRAALDDAASAHVRRAADCQAGRAPEQHFWELELLRQRRGEELGATEPLAVYDSPGWLALRDEYMSTSSAPSVHIRAFGFGSTGSHCIGVGYVLLPDRLIVHLSAPRELGTETARFGEELRPAFDELGDLLAAES